MAILKIADFGLSAVVCVAEQTMSLCHGTGPDGEAKTRDTRHGNAHNGHSHGQHRVGSSSSNSHPKTTTIQLTTTTPESVRRLRSVVGSSHYVSPEVVMASGTYVYVYV